MVNDQVLPFELAVPAQDLARLRARIADTRWPEPQTVADGSQGTPILKLRALCEDCLPTPSPVRWLATARLVDFTNSQRTSINAHS